MNGLPLRRSLHQELDPVGRKDYSLIDEHSSLPTQPNSRLDDYVHILLVDCQNLVHSIEVNAKTSTSSCKCSGRAYVSPQSMPSPGIRHLEQLFMIALTSAVLEGKTTRAGI